MLPLSLPPILSPPESIIDPGEAVFLYYICITVGLCRDRLEAGHISVFKNGYLQRASLL